MKKKESCAPTKVVGVIALEMETVSPKQPTAKPIKGVVSDAAVLGVSRVHLREVLNGKRISAPLKARYEALQLAKNQNRQSQP